ncbi:hypothetical protein FACS1894164_18450 [Spirochaetia bacterium]|nr:hypothetical protein FACS1894164_18450 [Spirochaetia bacterium]
MRYAVQINCATVHKQRIAEFGMKDKFFLAGMAAMVLSFGLVLAGCGDLSGRPNGTGNNNGTGDSNGTGNNNSTTVYKVGDTGPAGGIIFYDKGFVSDGWRYLEAAPVEVEVPGIEAGTWVPNGTSVGTGSGKKNTEILVNYHEENGQTGKAAQLSNALVYNGYDDWFLPSKAELDLMYSNLKSKGLGGFSSGWYCSSSAASFGMWAQSFSNGAQADTNWNGNYDKTMDSSRVRSVRAF